MLPRVFTLLRTRFKPPTSCASVCISPSPLQVFFRPRKDHSDIAGELKRLLDEMQRSFERIEKNFREDFRLNREEGRIVARDNREELTRSMNEFRNASERFKRKESRD